VWEIVETKTGKIRMAEAEERRKRREIRKEEEKVKKESYTRELNRVLGTKCLPYIYWAHGLCYTNLTHSKEYIFVLRSICVIHAI